MKKILNNQDNFVVYDHITPDGMHYYGITYNIVIRWAYNGSGYRQTSLYPYIEKYGWDNIQHIVLYENLPYNDALSIEDSLILSGWENGNCINQRRSGNIKKEDWYRKGIQKKYRDQHKKEIKEYSKHYYEQNKDRIREYSKQYFEQNKEKRREYLELNRDKIREQHKQYRQKKKLEKQLKEVETTPLF